MSLLHVFRVDWNSLRNGEVGTLLTLASDPMRAQLQPPVVGDVVGLVDDDDEHYEGWVTRRVGIWLSVKPHWPSRSYVRLALIR